MVTVAPATGFPFWSSTRPDTQPAVRDRSSAHARGFFTATLRVRPTLRKDPRGFRKRIRVRLFLWPSTLSILNVRSRIVVEALHGPGVCRHRSRLGRRLRTIACLGMDLVDLHELSEQSRRCRSWRTRLRRYVRVVFRMPSANIHWRSVLVATRAACYSSSFYAVKVGPKYA